MPAGEVRFRAGSSPAHQRSTAAAVREQRHGRVGPPVELIRASRRSSPRVRGRRAGSNPTPRGQCIEPRREARRRELVTHAGLQVLRRASCVAVAAQAELCRALLGAADAVAAGAAQAVHALDAEFAAVAVGDALDAPVQSPAAIGRLPVAIRARATDRTDAKGRIAEPSYAEAVRVPLALHAHRSCGIAIWLRRSALGRVVANARPRVFRPRILRSPTERDEKHDEPSPYAKQIHGDVLPAWPVFSTKCSVATLFDST